MAFNHRLKEMGHFPQMAVTTVPILCALLTISPVKRWSFFTSLNLGWPFDCLDQQKRAKVVFCQLREKPLRGLAASTSTFLEHWLLRCSLLEPVWHVLRSLSHVKKQWVSDSVNDPKWAFSYNKHQLLDMTEPPWMSTPVELTCCCRAGQQLPIISWEIPSDNDK